MTHPVNPDHNDEFQWLEQRDTPEVMQFLQNENQAIDDFFSKHNDFRAPLFEEIKARIKETDLSLPEPDGDFLYYQSTQAGDEYPRYFRCQRTTDLSIDNASQTLLLDPNLLAGEGFFDLGSLNISPNHRYMAYSLDTTGSEVYRLFIKDLKTNKTTELPFTECDGSFVWANNSRHFFFAVLDEMHRPYRIMRSCLGSKQADTVFTEEDQRFFVQIENSADEQVLTIHSQSKNTTEVWVLNANQIEFDFICVQPRQQQHEYYVDHGIWQGNPCWFIQTNRDGINFALYISHSNIPSQSTWQLLFAHDPQRMLESFTLNQFAVVLSYREQALPVLEIHNQNGRHRLTQPDAVYNLSIQNSLEFKQPCIRLRYESLNRPAQISALNLQTLEQKPLKSVPVLGQFNADDYQSIRVWATAQDGTQIPISLVAQRSVLQKAQAAPLYLYGYGAYGESLDAWFSHARLSLLNRGFIFAIAHVRGGGELGEAWYLNGKLEHKENTFNDFISCAEHLIAQGFTSSQQLVINGASAGGLLIGNVLNQRPDLFACAVAEVPFVDTLNTMLNPDLPLTITEYDEWGDPNQPEAYQRILSYSPYDNIQSQAYPAILSVAGYNDTRVQYWEAAKWVCKLRKHNLSQQPILLKTDLNAGHGGASGRYQALHDCALEYAFIFNQLGVTP
ncbi:S9 family peptidase [Pseudomonas sp. F1_0610]|uniref:S9 family peptidase n=1 Tax=Pseudomonas sp. F1_0610 TaxID=3114284 RepID=UPI0039C4C660